MSQKEKSNGRTERAEYVFYPKGSDSVLPEKQQERAQELLNMVAFGNEDAFDIFRNMFDRHPHDESRDELADEYMKTCDIVRGKLLEGKERTRMKKLCHFIAYYELGRADINGVQAAFAFADERSKQ